MAMVRASSSAATAEANLSQFLCEFGNVPAVDQKETFRRAGAPDAQATIELVTCINEECAVESEQCMGFWFMLFFECLQKRFRMFSEDLQPTTDTLIGSHPQNAALVRGGLKMVLLVGFTNLTMFK